LQKSDENTDRRYCPPSMTDNYSSTGKLIPGDWRREGNAGGLTDMSGLSSNRYSADAADVRQTFAQYFVSNEGSVSWQHDLVTSLGQII